MENFEALDGRRKDTLSPETSEGRATLNRNASFDLAQGFPKKTHVRTGSDYQKADFWARVADQTTYIDSTRSSLLVDQTQNQPKGRSNYASNSTPALTLPGGRTVLHRFSVRETKRNGKIARFYSHDHDNNMEREDELKVHQPLLYDGSRTSLAAIWAAVDNNNFLKKPLSNRKPSSWEESVSMERRRSLAAREAIRPTLSGGASPVALDPPITSLPGLDSKDLRYCFQHPYLRLFTTLTIIFCNFLLFAEDPISHSRTEAVIPLVGNVFSFVCTKYPPDWRWALIKVLMWIFAILCGLTMGKIFIHALIFGKYLRLKMFRDEQGSWIAMFLTVILSLYLFSHVYNVLLHFFYAKSSLKNLKINSAMGLTNSTVMKTAACGTWLGDLITWLMVTDVMLQDNLYPDWAPSLRRVWKVSNVPRILIFWIVSAVATALVVTLIVLDLISWDTLNRDLVVSTELSRAFLASFILVLDLVIMMQDWDFPHFTTTVHINLPGFSVSTLEWKYAEVNLTGKWFSYGLIFMVMMLDLNMWKNQIFYTPERFGQYTGPDHKIYTVSDPAVLQTGNATLWTWQERSKINEKSKLPYYYHDMQMNTRFMRYPLHVKCLAFLPSIVTLSIYIWLIYLYGRFPHKKDKTSTKTVEVDENGSSPDEGITV